MPINRMITEKVCPFCGDVTVFYHGESHNSPVRIVKTCQHAKSYTQDGVDIDVEFVDDSVVSSVRME